MKQQPHKDDISLAVMEQIKRGEVHMKPRIYFTALGFVSIALVLSAGAAIAYLSSILFFWARIESANSMAWGARANLSQSLASFPWWALILSCVLLAIAVILVRRHGHMYRHKTTTVALALIAGSLVVGLLLSLAGVGGIRSPGPANQPHEQVRSWQRNST
ncbi:hypothetical protein EOL96_00750 [Candidatus Saccharibacteria bacterium]|nr:hypothetical protein [Candidatus Saccharibacteria bacterium]